MGKGRRRVSNSPDVGYEDWELTHLVGYFGDLYSVVMKLVEMYPRKWELMKMLDFTGRG